jgi:hypothetical protein
VVEQSAVNRLVAGSNPACGAILESCPSGRRSTIGNRVGANSASRVRIPCSPPLISYYGPLVKWLRHRPFTAVTRVRIPYGSLSFCGGLAQLGEHLPYKQGVGGSIPSSSTMIVAGWSSPVARRAHNPKVAGSNPAPATNIGPVV